MEGCLKWQRLTPPPNGMVCWALVAEKHFYIFCTFVLEKKHVFEQNFIV